MADEKKLNPDQPVPRHAAVTVLCEHDRTQSHGMVTHDAVRAWLAEHGYIVQSSSVIELSAKSLESAFRALPVKTNLWVVCGGTGIGPVDFVPQMLSRISDFAVPGIGEFLRADGLKYSHHAPLSRCGGYVSKGRFILSIPGNHKAALEQLSGIQKLLEGALDAVAGQCKSRKKVGE